MKPTQHRFLIAFGLLAIAGALLFTTACGPEKHKIDESTVLPFKDKSELDSMLNLPILPEYTIEEYYTKTDFIKGDERFVVCCKFLKEVTPAEVQKIVEQVNHYYYYPGWHTFDMGNPNRLKLFFNLDTTLAADKKRPDILGDRIHVEIEIPCTKKDSWKGFEIVFRNDLADYSVVVNRDTLTKLLGVEFPELTETNRIDETIFFEFDKIPSEKFYQDLEKAPHWSVNKIEGWTFYDYDYDDGNVWISAHLTRGEANIATRFTFDRRKSLGINRDDGFGGGGIVGEVKDRLKKLREMKSKGESK